MSAAALLGRLTAQGVALERDGDRLKIRAPQRLKAKVLGELRECKAELLALLEGEAPDTGGTQSTLHGEAEKTGSAAKVLCAAELAAFSGARIEFLEGGDVLINGDRYDFHNAERLATFERGTTKNGYALSIDTKYFVGYLVAQKEKPMSNTSFGAEHDAISTHIENWPDDVKALVGAPGVHSVEERRAQMRELQATADNRLQYAQSRAYEAATTAAIEKEKREKSIEAVKRGEVNAPHGAPLLVSDGKGNLEDISHLRGVAVVAPAPLMGAELLEAKRRSLGNSI